MERYYDDGHIPWVKSGELREDLITSTEEHVTDAALHESSIKLVPAGAILIAMYGATVGRLAILGIEATTNQAVCHIIPDPELADTRYLYHAVSAQVPEIIAMGVGGAQPNISQAIIKDLKVQLPSLPEQRRIAAILDQADALRAKRREALAELDKLTQSLFIEMFGDPISNPRGWTKLPLESATSKVTDGEHINPELSESGMPIVMAGNVLENSIDMVGAKKVSEELGDRFRRKCKPELGDLLVVSRGATIGRMCAVNTNESFCLMGSVILLKLKKDRVNTDFMSALLKQPVMRSALYKTSGSSAQQAIYLKDLKNLSLICPPLELQQKFSSKVTKIVELKTRHSDSLDAINFLFSSLQHRAFRGEL